MNRREFIKGLFATAVVVGLPLPKQPVNLSVPFTWSKPGPPPYDKVAMIQQLLANAIEAHDRLIEEALFTSGGAMAAQLVYTP